MTEVPRRCPWQVLTFSARLPLLARLVVALLLLLGLGELLESSYSSPQGQQCTQGGDAVANSAAILQAAQQGLVSIKDLSQRVLQPYHV
jgi:hypothetical protein